MQLHAAGDGNRHHETGDGKAWSRREAVDKVHPLLHFKTPHYHPSFEPVRLSCFCRSLNLIHILACKHTIIWQQFRAQPALEDALLPEAGPFVSLCLEPEGLESRITHGHSAVNRIAFQEVYLCPNAVVIWSKCWCHLLVAQCRRYVLVNLFNNLAFRRGFLLQFFVGLLDELSATFGNKALLYLLPQHDLGDAGLRQKGE